MTMQSFARPIPLVPLPPELYGANLAAATFTLDGTDDRVAWLFRTQTAAVTIDAACFRSSTVTTGATDALSVQIFTVNATNGRPDSAVGNAVLVTTTTSTPATYEVTGLNASLSANTDYMLVVTWLAGNQAIATRYQVGTSGYPYSYTLAGPSTHSLVGFGSMICAVGTSATDYLYFPEFLGPVNLTTQTITDAGNPDEVGCAFTVPGPARLIGWITYNAHGASAWNIKAYSTPVSGATLLSNGGTDLNTLLDPDISANAASRVRVAYFPAHYDLSAGVEYGITMRAGTSGNFVQGQLQYTDADHAKAFGGGLNLRKISRQNDTGDFTADATVIPAIWPLITGIDDGAGGGSPIIVPNITRNIFLGEAA